jgi:L,D-peptidoglycan transpeptidase YkuD (ErfK/YbiS/YcfS/YnhG family)
MMEFTRRSFMAGLGGTFGYGLVGRGAMATTTPVKQTAAQSSNTIQVTAKPKAIQGVLKFAGKTYDCRVGQNGITTAKHEGDGCTPAGLFRMLEVRYRADRLSAAPQSGLPVFKTSQSDGWCDDPSDVAYNRIVHLPYQTDAESMWREDNLYDVLGVIGYNSFPVQPGAGSAIFLHVMRPATDDHQYTSGCVSLKIEDVLAVLANCTPSTMIQIRTVV